MSENTYSEPWKIQKDEHGNCRIVDTSGGQAICPIFDCRQDANNNLVLFVYIDGNYRDGLDRTVACVNALSGIENPEAIPAAIQALRYASANSGERTIRTMASDALDALDKPEAKK